MPTEFAASRWEESEVNQRLDTCMKDAFHAIWDVHEAKKVPLRTAAFIKALQRVTRVSLAVGQAVNSVQCSCKAACRSRSLTLTGSSGCRPTSTEGLTECSAAPGQLRAETNSAECVAVLCCLERDFPLIDAESHKARRTFRPGKRPSQI